MTNNTINFLAERKNPILKAREDQFAIHDAAYAGGNVYKEKRLMQFPNETEADFKGSTSYNGSKTSGRKEYSPAISYARQIADDITNLTFFNEPVRSRGNPDILSNINGLQDNIDTFMRRINTYYTLYGWTFIKIDYPDFNTEGNILSIADKEQMNIRPFWFTIKPQNVVDWSIDRTGLNWLLEEDYQYFNATPYAPAVTMKVRRLWEKGKVTIIKYLPKKDKRTKQKYDVEVKNISYPGIPWVVIGTPSIEPNRFESIESLNAHILNLESSNADVFFNSAFPQAWIAEKTFEKIYQQQLSKHTLQNQGTGTNGLQIFDESRAIEAAFNIAVGTKRPLILGEGESPHIPSLPNNLEKIRDEIAANLYNLQKLSGIALNASQDASGIARAFDLLTVESIVKERTDLLQNAERQAVDISSQYDNDFTPWTVEYDGNITDSILTPHAVNTQT